MASRVTPRCYESKAYRGLHAAAAVVLAAFSGSAAAQDMPSVLPPSYVLDSILTEQRVEDAINSGRGAASPKASAKSAPPAAVRVDPRYPDWRVAGGGVLVSTDGVEFATIGPTPVKVSLERLVDERADAEIAGWGAVIKTSSPERLTDMGGPAVSVLRVTERAGRRTMHALVGAEVRPGKVMMCRMRTPAEADIMRRRWPEATRLCRDLLTRLRTPRAG